MRVPRRRQTQKHAANPTPQALVRRLADLRAMLVEDAPAAGDQGLKLLEEYLEQVARSYGYADEGSLRRYTMFLRGQHVLDEALLARIDIYTDARNCLAHTYGIQATPEFAAEVIDFLHDLLAEDALTAEHLMTRVPQTIASHMLLSQARDLMLKKGYGRLPVLENQRVVGLLTERDIVVAQARTEQGHPSFAMLRVADALPTDALDRVAFVGPNTTRDEIAALLRRPNLIVCLVTPDGQAQQIPIGIITHADLLDWM
ncbi:MAG: CBS domain-containing protein [Roseiflexaceae bacterium]|nr:CBS domain-containing protein [Roseiflexaceae bacterium]